MILPFLCLLSPWAHPQDQVAATALERPAAERWTLREIDVQTAPIWGPERARANALRQLIDATHWTTRESVVRREIWKQPGDIVDAAFAAELERNLRATGLFATATVELVPTEDSGGDRPGVCDLRVRTQDRLSISGGASGSFVGDIASGGFSLAESNLFGTGDRASFSFFENDLGEFRGTAAYRDRYLFGSWTSASVRGGRTDDGPFSSLSIDRPFRYLQDSFAWSVSAQRANADRDYFNADANVAEVPFEQSSVGASATWRTGSAFRFLTGGLRARAVEHDYGTARGPAAAGLRVPGDTTSTFAGVALGGVDIRSFEKVTGLDTLQFVQDLELSTAFDLEVGGTLRDESGGTRRVQPTAGLSISDRRRVADGTFVSASIDGNARLVAGEAVGWAANANVSLFYLPLKPHTLAFAARVTEADESEDLPVQLVLGEGRGLRGYPRDQFTGQRVATFSFEDRLDLDAHLGSLDFGAALFADIGWAAERGEGFGRPFKTVGAGLRIGSNELFGRGVLRLDVSVPLDDVAGESFDPLVSFSLGQTFGFGGR